MHRPHSIAESPPPVRLWLRAHGRQALVLAVLYFVFGHASFLVQVDDVLVTPVLFASEGIALAMALRFGAAVWPGVFAGQLVLALSRGLAPWPAVSISAVNSLEVVLAVFLFRAFKLDATLPRARDLAGLLLLVFFVLQPFSATLGNATLWAGGIIDRAELPTSWLSWWIGNSFGQMLVAPLLLALFAGGRTKRQTAVDFVVPLLVILPAFWAADYLLRWTGVPSLVVVFGPILVLLAIYRGLAAVCAGAILIALGALYATSHAFGPFVSEGRADIPGLNLFIIGLALSGQFLAVFLRQTEGQQKLADELRDARERLQRTAYELTENIPVGTYVLEFDTDGKPHFTFLSERFLAMNGLKREELMANHALALQPMSSSGRSEIERLNREVFASKKTFFWEGEITVRGEKRHVTLESMPRSRSDGGTIWEGVMTDVTERRKSEQQLRLVLDNLPIAVAATTLTSPADLTFINQQFTRTFGYMLEDVPTVAAWAEKAYPDPDYRREVFRNWDQAVFRAIETRGGVELMEFEVTCQDGTKRDIVFGAVVLDERLLVSMTDVTELKKAERQVRSLREEIERAAFEVTENIPVGTYTMVQPRGGGMASFSFMSTRFLELTGLERCAAEADPLTAFACVHPDDYDEWVRKNAYVFEHKLPFKEETRVVVKGETRWILAESTPRDAPDGSVVWEGVLQDITGQKEAAAREKELELTYRRELESKLKTSLTASAVAHEINQPLSTILLQSKMALESETGTRDILQSIAAEAQRVVVTIDKMKTLLRNVQTDHRQIDLAEVVQSTLLYNKGLLARHNIRVRCTGLKKPCRIMGDDAQLQLALTNLLRNAVEAIEESQPEKREIAVAIKAGSETVELIVGDSGPGWSGAPLVETPLHTTKKDGTGIGLYVVRTAMENHRGEITFGRSALGGAEVRLRFPRVVWVER